MFLHLKYLIQFAIHIHQLTGFGWIFLFVNKFQIYLSLVDKCPQDTKMIERIDAYLFVHVFVFVPFYSIRPYGL